MKLRPIYRSDAAIAADLLVEGFPVHSRQTWMVCLTDIFTYGETLGCDSIGQFASLDGGKIGIGLTIPSRRVAYVATVREVVNLSAFYLRPGNEWMTALFLRRLMTDPVIDYIDLSASESMRQLNRNLGLVDRSLGAVIVPLAASALRLSPRAKIIPLADISPGVLSDIHRDLLLYHARLGCIAVGIEFEDACHPLILAPSRRRGVDGARVILARDRRLVRSTLGTVARYLLKRGFSFLEFEAVTKAGFPEAFFRTGASPLQSRHDQETEAIDHTFTELAFMPPPGFELDRPRLLPTA